MCKIATLNFLMGFNVISPLWTVLHINRSVYQCVARAIVYLCVLGSVCLCVLTGMEICN